MFTIDPKHYIKQHIIHACEIALCSKLSATLVMFSSMFFENDASADVIHH